MEKRSELCKSTIVCLQREQNSWASMILNDEESANSILKRATKHYTVVISKRPAIGRTQSKKSGTLCKDARYASVLLYAIYMFPDPACPMGQAALTHHLTFRRLTMVQKKRQILMRIKFIGLCCFYHGIDLHAGVCPSGVSLRASSYDLLLMDECYSH